MIKIKIYIITYNSQHFIDRILNNLKECEIPTDVLLQTFVIQNHTNGCSNIKERFPNVKVLNNVLRPDFSKGHLARNWNQALINGFKSLKNPDCNFVVCLQHDVLLRKDWIEKMFEYHKNYDFITFGAGDAYMSFTPNAVKKIGIFDEHFCNIGYQEADYFKRAYRKLPKKSSINDSHHCRIHNPLNPNLVLNIQDTGCIRQDKDTIESMKYHDISRNYGFEKWNTYVNHILKEGKQRIKQYMLYPYFEKDIDKDVYSI